MTESQPEQPPEAAAPPQAGQPPPDPRQQPYAQSQQPPPAPAPYAQQPPYGQPYPQAYPQPYRPSAPMSPEDQRLWATLGHISGALFHLIGPLVVYLIVRDRGPYVRTQAAEALNFWITVDIALLVSMVLIVVLIGLIGLFFIPVAAIVLAVVAAVATNRGEDYRYPVNLRLVH